MIIPLLGSATPSRSVRAGSHKLLNVYPEITPDGKNMSALYGRAGLDLVLNVGANPIRGMWHLGDYLYVVSGNVLYKVTSSYVATNIGTLMSNSGVVSMADNGTQIMIVDGGYGYIYNATTLTFSRITDTDFTGADRVVFLDGYFLFNVPNTGRFMLTSLYDGLTIAALDYATAEGNPDNLLVPFVVNREVWLMGEESAEIWVNSGATNFPIERLQGGFVENGIVGKNAGCVVDNSVFWVSSTEFGHGVIYRSNGYTPVRISTHAIETELAKYSTINDCISYAYQAEGHLFVAFTFPTDDKTWVYDVSIQDQNMAWHEECSLDSNGVQHRHFANCYNFYNSVHLIGDFSTGKVYKLNNSTYSDNGATIKRQVQLGHVNNEATLIRHIKLQADFEPGVGLSTGQGSDPQASLIYSNNGGITFTSERWRSIGKIGAYLNQVIWRQLGVSRDRVYSLTVTDPIKFALVGMYLEVLA